MKKRYLLFTICNLPLASCCLFPSIANEGSKQQRASSKQRLSRDSLLLFVLLSTLILGGCTSASSGESKVMQELRETNHLFHTSKLVQTSYFFYPSTMRMVNIDRMPNWDEAIKDVRRLSLFSMWPDRFDQVKQNEVVADLEEKENFGLYAELEDKHSNFKLLGRNNGKEAILIYNDSTVSYVVHLLGKLNYVKLMKLFGDIKDAEDRGAGIDLLVKAMGQDTDRATRRRSYSDRRREREAAEQLRQDSIQAAQTSEITE